jgi:hypothetical protein
MQSACCVCAFALLTRFACSCCGCTVSGGRSTSYSEATTAPADPPVTNGSEGALEEQEENGDASQQKKEDPNDVGANGKSNDGTAVHAKPAAGAAPPPFRFFHLLHSVHERVVALPA